MSFPVDASCVHTEPDPVDFGGLICGPIHIQIGEKSAEYETRHLTGYDVSNGSHVVPRALRETIYKRGITRVNKHREKEMAECDENKQLLIDRRKYLDKTPRWINCNKI